MNDNLPILQQDSIQNRIFTIRNMQVMIDRDLAELYDVSTKVLNQSVKRNLQRFPDAFRFQLSENEKTELVTNCDWFEKLKHSSTLPYAAVKEFGKSLNHENQSSDNWEGKGSGKIYVSDYR